MYPCLYIAILEHLQMVKEKQEYMDKCKQYEHGTPEDYGKYVHGYFIPWLNEQRKTGKLKQSKYLYL